MKKIVLLLAVLVGIASAQFGKVGGVSATTMLTAIADSNRWTASGTTRITPRLGKAIYADSIIVNYTVITYDSVRNTLKVGGLGGSSTPMTVQGNKTTGNLIYAYNDKDATIDSLFRVDAAGKVRNQPYVYSITIDSTEISTARNIPFFYVSEPIVIDTVIVVGVTTAAAGTFSVVPQIAHDDTLKSAVAVNVINTPGAATSKTIGTRYTSFTDATLIGKEWAWVKFTTVTTAPKAVCITVIGRK